MKEEDGEKEEACKMMQDVQVETLGSMVVGEKTDFILEQVRLCLDTNDAARAFILSNKVARPVIAKAEHEALRLRFCALMVRYWATQRNWLEVAQSHDMAYSTPSVLGDRAARAAALRDVAVNAVLAPFGSAQHDLVQRVLADRNSEEVPLWRNLLVMFNTMELIRWKADVAGVYAKSLSEVAPFSGAPYRRGPGKTPRASFRSTSRCSSRSPRPCSAWP